MEEHECKAWKSMGFFAGTSKGMKKLFLYYKLDMLVLVLGCLSNKFNSKSNFAQVCYEFFLLSSLKDFKDNSSLMCLRFCDACFYE
jgi:hypothetical protein